MLEQMFLKVMDMSRIASIVIVAVFLVRMLLKRFPKSLSYLLWSVVLFRLLCPVTLESDYSPVPNLGSIFYDDTSEKNVVSPEAPDEWTVPYTDGEAENVPENAQVSPGEAADTQVTDTQVTDAQVTDAQAADAQGASAQFHLDGNVRAAEVSWQERFILFGKYVWLAGISILFLYCVISAVMVRNKVSASIPLKENIYMADEAISPFVMGIFNPRIYLPEGLSEKEQEYIILHEKFHIRRFDHIVKPVAFAALCVHWFNPLVWFAFVFFCKDMEMSCDEAVIKRLGETVRADYSDSLLALSTQRRIIGGIPVDFGEGDVKGRVKNLAAFRKTKGWIMAVLIAGVVILTVCLAFTRKTFISDSDASAEDINDEINIAENGEMTDQPDESDEVEPLHVSVDITDYYITHKGNSSNLYHIDENHVLWGCGRNEYGQLGQGTQDYDFHEDMIKIAENVVHVDFSLRGFVIFITEDHRLYGMGDAAGGALQQYTGSDWSKYINGGHCYVSEPYLLAVNVAYARCGRDDIVCLKEDGSVWTWGTVYRGYFIASPQKIFESAVLVTGGWYHHAALLPNGTVWTWGYNEAGNCGVADLGLVSQPTMVAEDVVMVWTDFVWDVDSYPPDAEDIVMAWTGKLKDTEHDTIAEYDGWCFSSANTVIQKADGSYWVCGENVGTEEKVAHGEEGDYSVICTHEFYPLNSVGETGHGNANENEPATIQTFTESDVAVTSVIEEYDFTTAKDRGSMQQIRGMLPGTSEGVWYIASIDGVEYYYGKYDQKDAEEAEYFGYAIFSSSYSLQNGISVGMTMDEVLEKYPDMAVMNFDGSYLDKEVTGHQGWNPAAYPRSYVGMDEDWDYAGKDYEWSDRFDCIMIADIDLGAEDTLPRYLALMIKDHAVAAITFYCPTAG